MRSNRRRPLDLKEIISWAVARREATGHFPTKDSGLVARAPGETWLAIDSALRRGLRGLPGGSSLAQLLAAHCGHRNIHGLPDFNLAELLEWADHHHAAKGVFPTADSGNVLANPAEKWSSVDNALNLGQRGLPGGSSLARLLAEHRGIRNRKALPPYTRDQLRSWCAAWQARAGTWPKGGSGPIPDAPGETWLAVDVALRQGRRGLPGGSSLPRFLAEEFGVRVRSALSPLTLERILTWMDAFHAAHGRWPDKDSGPVDGAPGETWSAIDSALTNGRRGLPGGMSLASLLGQHRGVRNKTNQRRFRCRELLRWMDHHRDVHGVLPTKHSGPIPESPGDTWQAVDTALRDGCRGLRGGSSLAKFLSKYRGRRTRVDLPRLSYRKIEAMYDAHKEVTGEYPNRHSGPVLGHPGETWKAIDNALRQGDRGLPGGSSLLRRLVKRRGVRDPRNLPPLTEAEIRNLAESHRQRTGALPKYNSGAVHDAPGETWAAFDSALRYGTRQLPGGSSLARLLASETEGDDRHDAQCGSCEGRRHPPHVQEKP